MAALLVLEVGPAVVRALSGPAAAVPSPVPSAAEEAALDCVDEPVALVGQQPVGVDRLWATVLSGALAGAAAPALMVCPSWWPRSRVERVRACAGGPPALTRAAVVAARRGREVVLVEIAPGLVAVSADGSTRVLPGWDPAEVVGAAASAGREVLVDAPHGVPGASQAAAGIRDALRLRGVATAVVDPAELAAEIGAGRRRLPPLRAVVRAAAGLSVAVLAVAGLSVWGAVPGPPPPEAPGHSGAVVPATLVEGHVAVVIPPDWLVTRVTGGPGSPRVQVDSPADGDAALHITQSHTPGSGLAEAAEVLGRAVAAARPAGVFVDFRTDGETAGRPALTYREVRPGRVIHWSVLQDGSTRIGIGCQSAPEREESVRAACREAVRSARELSAPRQPG